jgi:homoserine kinase
MTPYNCSARQIPGLPEILASLTPQTHDGLLGICLSGAGPTILALATHDFDVSQPWIYASGIHQHTDHFNLDFVT